ncbi:porin family protein [Spirosoma radiotolerans]|uniref:Outer membrane protein beta-barrel domain-containing protein n=1 Tax=Spirosoma radiotolerans TaxID=1379870 RepID=A0A0E3V8I7_9BACT|nr:porin family protein [Spirosoma radiotolerans]AKD56787.1 hypothetical protein SD10_19655 [Spirosoma radiotolerans]
MKAKLIVLLLVLTGLKEPILAQSALRLGLSGGLNGNLIHANYLGPNSESKGLWDYTGGISLEHRLTPSFTVTYNLLYSRQGGIELITSKLGLGSDQMISKLSYLTLPAMLRYQFGVRRVFISGGPQIGYFLKAEWYAARFGEGSAERWNLSSMHRFDAGLTAGIGYRLGRHFVIESRYYYGLNPINKPDNQTHTYYNDYKEFNRTWASNLVYYF